jgi:hypothetical protein
MKVRPQWMIAVAKADAVLGRRAVAGEPDGLRDRLVTSDERMWTTDP